MAEEVGLEWGFEDPQEANKYPLTSELYKIWYGKWQCTPAMDVEDIISTFWYDPEEGEETEWDWI